MPLPIKIQQLVGKSFLKPKYIFFGSIFPPCGSRVGWYGFIITGVFIANELKKNGIIG